MKKFTAAIIYFLLLSFSSFAQDVIYTISGELNNQKVPLDSILVENLTNKTWVMYNDLPEAMYYQVNLSKNLVTYTSEQYRLESDAAFVQAKNFPGTLELLYVKNTPEKVNLFVYNILGQIIHSEMNKLVNPGQLIRVQPGAAGTYLIKTVVAQKTESFKMTSLDEGISGKISFLDGMQKEMKEKSASNAFAGDFSFNAGDSLRISVFKNNLFVNPVKIEIELSDYLNFKFANENDSVSVINGTLQIDGINNQNFTRLTVYSSNGTFQTKINNTFQVTTENPDDEEFPLLFELNGNVLFGYFPSTSDNNHVTIDDILLFFLKLHPAIANQGFSNNNILDQLRLNTNYNSWKNTAIQSINAEISPADNTDFVQQYFSIANALGEYLLNNTQKVKSLSPQENEDFIFQFNFERDGEINWDKSAKLFAAIGVQIKNSDNNTLMYQTMLQPLSVNLSFESLISYGTQAILDYFNEYLFDGDKENIESYKFTEEGEYIISFSNGNGGITSPDFENKIRTRNNKLIAFKILTSVAPVGLKKILGKEEAAEAIAGLMSNIYNTTVEVIGSETFDYNQVPALARSIYTDAITLIYDIVGKKLSFWDRLSVITEKLEPLGHVENISNLIFMIKDTYNSEVSDKQARYFYDGISYGKLNYKTASDSVFFGVQNSLQMYTAELKEETVKYDIEVPLTERIFLKKVEMKDAGGLPFVALALKGDPKFEESSNLVTKSEGFLFMDFSIGEQDTSLIEIKPDFMVKHPFPTHFVTAILLKPDTLIYVDGNSQPATQNEYLAKPLKVKVLDNQGNPLEGVTVHFEPTCDECGSVDNANPVTDEEGIAQTRWKISNAGITSKLKAEVANYPDIQPVYFYAGEKKAAFLTLISGLDQKGIPGEKLSEPVTLIVTDSLGNPVPGVEVGFFRESDYDDFGLLNPSITSISDINGIVELNWIFPYKTCSDWGLAFIIEDLEILPGEIWIDKKLEVSGSWETTELPASTGAMYVNIGNENGEIPFVLDSLIRQTFSITEQSLEIFMTYKRSYFEYGKGNYIGSKSANVYFKYALNKIDETEWNMSLVSFNDTDYMNLFWNVESPYSPMDATAFYHDAYRLEVNCQELDYNNEQLTDGMDITIYFDLDWLEEEYYNRYTVVRK